MKIQVDFYADAFRKATIDIPSYLNIKPRTTKAEDYIEHVLNSSLLQMGIFPPTTSVWRTTRNDVFVKGMIKIIRTKILT